MAARWLALVLGMMLATFAHAEPVAKDTADKPAAEGAATEEAAAKPAKSRKAETRKTDKRGDKKKAAQDKVEKTAKAAKPSSDEPKEPKTTTVDKLPGPLKKLHVCAMPRATVEIDTERYAKSTIFLVSCTAQPGGLTPHAVYAARDAKGTGAKLITFEAPAADGTTKQLDMLYSVMPVREAFTMDGDPQPHAHVREDTPWFVGAWKPDDRPEICAIAATWRLNGDKGELYLWEEAKECPKGELPKYEIKVDKKPPALVGR
jgi:hypothetical protein